MRWPLLLLIAVSGVSAAMFAGDAPRPGQTPTDPEQLVRLKAARQELAAALRGEDADGIEKAETTFRKALGTYGGVPEAAEELTPKGTKAPRPTGGDYRKLVEQMGRLGSGSANAKNNRMELRHAAYLAIGLLALSEADPKNTNAHRKQAAAELDFLIGRQAAEGYFPYPADPVAPPHLQQLAAKAAKEHPDKVKDGFIYLDADGAQFDTGCCAYALAYGDQVLKEPRFLKAARKAGDWAVAFPLSSNWNYNSFSVWQLAKLYEITNDQKYLDRAVRIAKLGVLPGQMETGRWSDQHNAKAVYHWIMVRALAALLRILPEDARDARFIRDRTKLAVQTRVDDITREGGGNSVMAFVGLAEALEAFGPNEEWEWALAQIGGINPYTAGVYARRRATSK